MKAEFQGKIHNDISFTRDRKQIVSFEIEGDFRETWDELNGKEIDIAVKPHREKRSLDANAYAWALIGKIADAIRSDKDSVYFQMLKRYGQQFVCKIPNSMIDSFKRTVDYWEEHEKLEKEEKAQYFKVYIGSSKYDTAEMSVLIDGIISECNELHIPTETPDKIAEMMSIWNTQKA